MWESILGCMRIDYKMNVFCHFAKWGIGGVGTWL